MLIVNKIDVFYGEMQILFGTSLMVNEREIVTIIGSNGSGKTTTLATLSGMIHPKVGEIKFCGERIDHEVPHKIVQLGIVQVPEGRRVFPGMTVSENLELGSFIKRAKVERTEDARICFRDISGSKR